MRSQAPKTRSGLAAHTEGRCDDAAHRDRRQLITVPGKVGATRRSGETRGKRETLQPVRL